MVTQVSLQTFNHNFNSISLHNTEYHGTIQAICVEKEKFMKRLGCMTAAILVIVLALSGCAAQDYSDRIDGLESAVALQAQQIEALQSALSQSTTAATLETVSTEPTAEPEPVNFKQYAGVGPEILYDLLPDGFVHLFPEDTVISSSVGYNQYGYFVNVVYNAETIDQDSFEAFKANISDITDFSWEGEEDGGIIFTPDLHYNIYKYGGIVLNIVFYEEPDGFSAYLDSSLVDCDAYLLPEQLTLPPDDVSVTFAVDSDSVNTTLAWNGVSEETVDQVSKYYLEQLSESEVFVPEDLYARLDDYRAIRIQFTQDEEGYLVSVIIYNFTVEDTE